MPILTPPPPLSDRSPLKSVKDDISTAAKCSSPEPPKVKQIQPESAKPVEKATPPVKKPSVIDEPKTKLPTPEPDLKLYKATEGSEFYKLEDCDNHEKVEMETFAQILELDEDDEERDFSKSMVYDYFDQVQRTFEEMDGYYGAKNLERLSNRGHFLKGSSAALGLNRVQALCEKIQHCGALRDEHLDTDLSVEDAMTVMGQLLKTVKFEYSEAEVWLKDFFENNRTLDL